MSGAVRLIAGREIRSRLQQKGFRIGAGVVLLLIVVASVLPSLFSGDDDGSARYDIGVVGSQTALTSTLRSIENPKITVHDVGTAADARSKVKDGTWDAAVVAGPSLIAKSSGADVVAFLQQAYRQASTVDSLRTAGLTTDRIDDALNVAPLRVSSTDSSTDTQRQVIALVSVIVLFGQLTTFCTWVAMGVVEEKASRVVELILSSVRPLQLLTGKLLGIGALASGMLALMGAAALIGGTASGSITVPAAAWSTVVVAFVAFVLSFAFFGALAAALGSTVSRQEEVSGILMPVTVSLFVCYGASYAVASSPDSTVSRVFSIVPPISGLAMPGRIAHGGVPVLDVVLAAVLLLLAAAAVVLVAARIYRASVLHSGTRVSLARAWRGEAVGSAD